MMKHISLMVLIATSGFIAAEQPERHEDRMHSEMVGKREVESDEMRAIQDEEVAIPEVKEPSAIMVALRTFGIGIITKYYAIKGWVFRQMGY